MIVGLYLRMMLRDNDASSPIKIVLIKDFIV
jgi:hypothetical protein